MPTSYSLCAFGPIEIFKLKIRNLRRLHEDTNKFNSYPSIVTQEQMELRMFIAQTPVRESNPAELGLSTEHCL